MAGTRELLQDLLSINEICGGQMTVENAIRFYEHEMFVESGGSFEDYLESWDAFCEDRLSSNSMVFSGE